MNAVAVPATRHPAASASLHVDALAEDLRAVVRGEVRFDPATRGAYSTDASNYRQVLIGVVVPLDVDDAVAAIEVCRRHGAPLTSRGGGTSLAGQACNAAVVLDWSKYCHRLVSVDPEARTCVVEPGIVLDELNAQLAPHGLMFGPRPSTHNHCTLGGMIGNNSCGSTAQAYGKTSDNVERLDVVLYDGTRLELSSGTEAIRAGGGGEDRARELDATLHDIVDRHAERIREKLPHIPRLVSGYHVSALLPENGFHVAQALVGSEGTLVTVLRATLTLVPVVRAESLLVLGYDDLASSGDDVARILPLSPERLEGIDEHLIDFERAEERHTGAVDELPPGRAWLLVSFAGDDEADAERKARDAADRLSGSDGPSARIVSGEGAQALWSLREDGLGATAKAPTMPSTWPGWEDAAVPPDRLGDYLRDFTALLAEFGFEESSIYGHFGQGCVHCRLPFDLVTEQGVDQFRTFVERAADLVVGYGGSLSGEHGDGQSRAELLPRMFGDEVVGVFEAIKDAFDPAGMMNPGKVVRPFRLDQNLRLGADWTPSTLRTTFVLGQEGLQDAALRCVGVGSCRHHDGGVMCPSYMVTREEIHSTRGRSRLLFEMLGGHEDSPVTEGWRSPEVAEALDLCLACKGCKSDCPAGVDMATYKSEFLHHHLRDRLRPRSHYSMGWLPLVAAAASFAPGAVNLLTSTPPISRIATWAGGIDRERQIPSFARTTLQRWARDHRSPPSERTVLLWPDTFANHLAPEVGRAAIEVLEDAGFHVIVPQQRLCCGLTWITTGQLGVARVVLRRTLDVLEPYLERGIPVVGLEPSCTSVFRADGVDLLPGDRRMERLRAATKTLAEVLDGCDDWVPRPVDRKAVVQTHCHQHAVLGDDADRRVMRRAGIDADVLDSGCCGLAGDFGFQAGHYEISRAIGERVLLPAVREADPTTAVIADGFSCRTQIQQGGTGREPVHLAQLLAAGRSLPVDVDHPRAPSGRALVGLAGAAAATAVATVLLRRRGRP